MCDSRGMDIENARFWEHADRLVAASEIVIDRPGGSAHPRYPAIIYPFDYGYLAGTTSGDGEGIDIWRGSHPDSRVTAVIMTVDVHKRDAELKFLVGCTAEEERRALSTHQTDWQAATLIRRTDEPR